MLTIAEVENNQISLEYEYNRKLQHITVLTNCFCVEIREKEIEIEFTETDLNN